MTDIKWIKIRTDIFDDEKIKLIDHLPEKDAIFVIWVKLLTLAGKINDSGQIYLTENMPYNEEMLSTIFNRPVSIIRLALETFVKFNMIEWNDDYIGICNWEKHQSLAELDKIKEQNRLRQAKFREKQQRNVIQTLSNGTEKKRIEKNKNINILFEKFWNTYDKKVGDKKSCEKKWKKLKDGEREKIMQTLPAFKKQFTDKQFQPYPATYLNQERWNDEILEVKQEAWTPKPDVYKNLSPSEFEQYKRKAKTHGYSWNHLAQNFKHE